MSDIILSVKDLMVNYGGIEAVKGISFDVPAGNIVTLIGANGAGKSTTLKAIVGLVKPRSGSIVFDGEELAGKDTTNIVSKGITLTFYLIHSRRTNPEKSLLLYFLFFLRFSASARIFSASAILCSRALRKLSQKPGLPCCCGFPPFVNFPLPAA